MIDYYETKPQLITKVLEIGAAIAMLPEQAR